MGSRPAAHKPGATDPQSSADPPSPLVPPGTGKEPPDLPRSGRHAWALPVAIGIAAVALAVAVVLGTVLLAGGRSGSEAPVSREEKAVATTFAPPSTTGTPPTTPAPPTTAAPPPTAWAPPTTQPPSTTQPPPGPSRLDNPPSGWVVFVASYPGSEPLTRALAASDAWRSRGLDTQVLATPRYTTLRCCYWSVYVGPFTSRAEAVAARTGIAAQVPDAYEKQL